MENEIICIVCPNGCHLAVESTPQGFVIKGNKCPRGEKYATDETTDPRRVVTCVVGTDSPEWPCAPVKSSSAVPKKLISQLINDLYSRKVHLPVKKGELLEKDYPQTGIDIVFTRTLPPGSMEKV